MDLFFFFFWRGGGFWFRLDCLDFVLGFFLDVLIGFLLQGQALKFFLMLIWFS